MKAKRVLMMGLRWADLQSVLAHQNHGPFFNFFGLCLKLIAAVPDIDSCGSLGPFYFAIPAHRRRLCFKDLFSPTTKHDEIEMPGISEYERSEQIVMAVSIRSKGVRNEQA